MLAHVHGRIDHAIAEQPAGGQPVGHVLKIVGRRPRTVQQQLVVVAPDLGVAGHRLVVQADVVRGGAQEHVGQLVLGAGDGQRVFVAMDPLPAVRAAERVADRPIDVRFVADRRGAPRAASPTAECGSNRRPRGGRANAARESARPAAVGAGVPGRAARRRRPGCPGTAASAVRRPGRPCGPPRAGTSKGRRSSR